MKIGCSWSGGKDSCYALMKALNGDHQLSVLVNMMNENGKISRSHGLPASVLMQQANAMEVPLVAQPTSWNDYQQHFIQTLQKIKQDYKVEAMVFGDIDLQEHRDWEEMVCQKAGLKALLPLWKQERKKLVLEMLDSGIKSMIVSCNTSMGEEFLGRMITPELVMQLESMVVDVCGENGEFHTVVINCPLFKSEISLPVYKKVLHENYWFLEWES
jgi:diphthine-ammonia ligase